LTTVVCNKEEMACDLCFTQNGAITWKGKTKIYKFKAHPDTYPVCEFIIGFAGTANDIITAVEFFNNPDDFKKVPPIKGLTGLVLTQQKDIYMFNELGKWIGVDEPYASIGSGSPFALGAMAAGSTPKEAVKAATARDPYTGLGIKTLSFK
jgi:ATP-dependent protease HslVU (ClpYQ) peptidase subunit